ncbi:MAG TPA: HAD family hydrolase [Puia sp.]|nr:HAD family hydrolase [Puia sp.]
MTGKIAFLDFDGTVTTKDTLLEFIKYCKGTTRFYLGFVLNGPWMLAYKIKLISNQRAKERILRHFFRRTPLDRFQQICDAFSRDRLAGLLRPKALGEIARLKEAGVEVVIVSASPENWIRGWTAGIGAELLATRLETMPGRENTDPPLLTGRIQCANCHGEEKVRRIKEAYDLGNYRQVYAYGDSPGDRPMLGLATAAFYKPFR